jgi:sucrose phosphorylase
MTQTAPTLSAKLAQLIGRIYPVQDPDILASRVIAAFWPDEAQRRKRARMPGERLWSEKDAIVIAYGNSVIDGEHEPLHVLDHFLNHHLRGTVNTVHVLSYFPFTSDDGFAVTDYREVNRALGDWSDIRRIAGDFTLMSDLVLNHVSSQGKWFKAYLEGEAPYDRFFFEASPGDDLSDVVRPRTSSLLREVETANGTRHVWCTFSHDQVDLDFRNPEVLLEFIRIMRLHIDHGVRILRLDAVAYLWKEVGTACIHLPQTHAIVQLFRVLCDFAVEPVLLLTETNVPAVENLSYFGNRNEAHAVYNFSLPPLILHALLSGSAEHLHRWQVSMPPAQLGCTYLNFTASHDGIGMRPAEGILPQEDIDRLVETVQAFGGRVSMRSLKGGGEAPYELNITFFDAMKGTFAGGDGCQIERFLCSQTIVMALEGIPAFYIHSFLATPNDHEGIERTGLNRSINRHHWDYQKLRALLGAPDSAQSRVLSSMKDRIGIRARQPAFHPNAAQSALHLDHRIFGVRRQSVERDQSIFALHNVSGETVSISPLSLNLIESEDWMDLLTGEHVAPAGADVSFAPYQCRWITNRTV